MLKKDEVLEIVKEVFEIKTRKDAESKLAEFDKLVKAVADSLELGDKARIGSFVEIEYKHVDAKTARNPKTGESIAVPEKQVYKIKATKQINKAE